MNLLDLAAELFVSCILAHEKCSEGLALILFVLEEVAQKFLLLLALGCQHLLNGFARLGVPEKRDQSITVALNLAHISHLDRADEMTSCRPCSYCRLNISLFISSSMTDCIAPKIRR